MIGSRMNKTARAIGGRAPCMIPLTAARHRIISISQRTGSRLSKVRTNGEVTQPREPGHVEAESADIGQKTHEGDCGDVTTSVRFSDDRLCNSPGNDQPMMRPSVMAQEPQ